MEKVEYTDEKIIVEKFCSGSYIKDLAKEFNKSEFIIAKILKKNKVKRVYNCFKVDKEDVLNRFKSGQSIGDIAKFYKTYSMFISKIIKNFNEVTKNSYKVNEDIFSLVDKGSSYWAGFIYASSNISKNGKSIIIKTKDEDFLIRLCEFIGRDKYISYNGSKYTLTICSKKIIKDLYENFGIDLINKRNFLYKNDLKHKIEFIKGYCDFSLKINYHKCANSIRCYIGFKNKEIINYIVDLFGEVKVNKFKNSYSINFYCNSLFNFLKCIYGDYKLCNKKYVNNIENILKLIDCNKNNFRKKNCNRVKNRLKNDIQFKLKHLCRSRIRNILKTKGIKNLKRTEEIIGCTVKFLKEYLESKFKLGMSWDNIGMWHIDHIIPLSTFDLTNEEELKKACNFSNLQPLWAEENLKKGNKIK